MLKRKDLRVEVVKGSDRHLPESARQMIDELFFSPNYSIRKKFIAGRLVRNLA